MAVYRIKKENQQEPSLEQPGSQEEPLVLYWQDDFSPDDFADLDFEEIQYLNSQYDEEEDDDYLPPSRKGFALLAFVVAVCFLIMLGFNLYATYGTPLPDLSFLGISRELQEEEPALAALKPAVVSVELPSSRGSGFNISADGLIVTNRHVVDGGGSINVVFPSGLRYIAKSWYDIEGVDLAIIKIEGKDLPYVPLATEPPEIDSDLVFIGNPLGFDWTVAKGKLLDYVLLADYSMPIMLLSGPIYSGSSGSPVFNEKGEVVAVIFASLRDVEKVGLAIPIEALGDLSGY